MSGRKPSANRLPWISRTGSPLAPCTSYSRIVPLSSACCMLLPETLLLAEGSLFFHAHHLQHFFYCRLPFAQQDGGVRLQVEHAVLERAVRNLFRRRALRHQDAQLSVQLEHFINSHAAFEA